MFLPALDALETSISGLVARYWRNPLLSRRSTYQSANRERDILPGVPGTASVRGITSFLCLYPGGIVRSQPSGERSPGVAYDTDSDYGGRDTEERRPLNDCVTDFVTNNFFMDATDRTRFLLLVCTVYRLFFGAVLHSMNTGRKTQIPAAALVLLLKGGMSLRMNMLEMIRDLSSQTEGELMSFMMNDLKMSDFDFEIVSDARYITPDDLTRINVLSYMVMQLLRNYLLVHMEIFFGFFRYSDRYQSTLLLKLRTRLQERIDQETRENPDSMYAGASVDAISISPVLPGADVMVTDPDLCIQPSLYSALSPNMMDGARRSDFSMVTSGKDPLGGARYADAAAPEDAGEPLICFVKSSELLAAYDISSPDITRLCTRSPLYTTHNPYIAFLMGDNPLGETPFERPTRCKYHRGATADAASRDTIGFQLNRIRYTTVVYLTLRAWPKDSVAGPARVKEYITGELLDVSHALDTDSKRSCPLCIGEKPWSFITSTVRFFPGVRFSIISPYEQYLAHFFMLFYQVKKPWSLPKYKKRVRRLFSIFVLFLFSRRSFNQYGDWSTRTFRDRIDSLQALVVWFTRLRTSDRQHLSADTDLPELTELSAYLMKATTLFRKDEQEDFYLALEDWLASLCSGRAMQHHVTRMFGALPNLHSILRILTAYRIEYGLEYATLVSLVRRGALAWSLRAVPLVPALQSSFLILYRYGRDDAAVRGDFDKLLVCVVDVLSKFLGIFRRELLFLSNGLVFTHAPHDPSTLTNNMPGYNQ